MATVVEVAGGGVFPQLLEWAFAGVGPGWAARPAFLKGSPRCRRPSQPCRGTARRAGPRWAFAGVGPGWAARPAFLKGSPRCRRPSQPSGGGAGPGWAFAGVGPGWAARPAFLKGSPRCRRPSQPLGDGAGPGQSSKLLHCVIHAIAVWVCLLQLSV